jgi:hypothetical protein
MINPDLAAAHEWDELIFGGYICLTCSPKEDAPGYGEPESTVMWPCGTLRAEGMTDDEATEIVRVRYAAVNR